MIEFTINEESIGQLQLRLKGFVWTEKESKERELLRKQFLDIYNKEKINNLTKEEYFVGHGHKQGCLCYDLEWTTSPLGSIKGGTKYKYGYETDFPKIKSLLQKIISIENKKFYNKDGTISKELLEIVNLSKEINGFKTGRTVIPKLLSLYYPDTFLPIFNDQDLYLSKLLLNGFKTEKIGLELYLENNYILLKVKERLEELENRTFESQEFAELIYQTFPKEKIKLEIGAISSDEKSEEPIEALEVQHYQSLIHRNFHRLFKNLRYFDEEEQISKKGQYDTQTIGIIDFLAIDENENFVVIEIKRQATDKTIGQLLRYMGWVKDELCKSGQKVYGIIVAEQKDIYLDFALKVIPNVKFVKMGLSITLEEN